jgi:8-amino-7-oxononanoate synthase
VLRAEPDRPSAALRNASALATAARVPVPPSAVVPVMLGDPEVAVAVARQCLARGVRVGCFRPPSVPEGTSRLRLTARADLAAVDLVLAREVLADVLAPVGMR